MGERDRDICNNQRPAKERERGGGCIEDVSYFGYHFMCLLSDLYILTVDLNFLLKITFCHVSDF